MQNTTIIIGGKWGDEGKGKIASREAKNAKLVIRATGGANAGHTIVFDGKKIPLHLVPGGIVYPQTTCLIGQGVVIDLPILFDEIKQLEELGVPNVRERIKISGRAHIVFPYHKYMDALKESLKEHPIGTTKRGIGPCYEDKDARVGIRAYDLLLPFEKLMDKIKEATRLHYLAFVENGMEDCVIPVNELAREYSNYGWRIKDMIVNADILTQYACDNNEKIVVEGAQAYRLDKDYGDYPDCTSSNCVTAGCLIGAHLSHKAIKKVILVAKAYDSRVGNGVFPTEQEAHIKDDKVLVYDKKESYVGDIIREKGREYGASTGRPRRTGWFDAVVLKSASEATGADYICLNHMDTLGEIGKAVGEIKIAVAYDYMGQQIDYYPDDMNITGETPKPIYTTFKGGWKITSDLRDYNKLPRKAKQFINVIESITKTKVKFIGVGPDNEDLIVREEI